MLACSHQRAVQLYMESIRYQNRRIQAFRCDSYQDYRQHLCDWTCRDNDGEGGEADENCLIIGPRSGAYGLRFYNGEQSESELPKRFYLVTRDKSPFFDLD